METTTLDLTQLLDNLKKYKYIYKNENMDTVINALILKVEEDIEEIRQDHNQGDADDADR